MATTQDMLGILGYNPNAPVAATPDFSSMEPVWAAATKRLFDSGQVVGPASWGSGGGGGAPAGGGSFNVGSGNNMAPGTGGQAAGGAGGAGGNTAFGGSMGNNQPYYAQGTNPYLSQMGDALSKNMTDNFNNRVLPGIGSSAIAAGGYGGSRQGVIEANAQNDLQSQIGSALTNLYGNGYNTGLQYDLGRRSNDLGYYNAGNSYNLGLGNLGLGYANLDRNINNDNNSWALQGAQLGNNTWNQLNNNNLTGLNAGNTIQNTPMDYLNGFTNLINGVGRGYSTSTGSTNTNGNPLLGALGGMDLGGQIGNLWGSGGGGSSGGSGLGLKGPSTGFWSTP